MSATALCASAPTDWNLRLTAACDDAARAVRFLTGAVMACGGWVISRSLAAGGTAIEFAFARATCVEMYSLLLAAGLELSAASHQALAILCLCTRETEPLTAEDLVAVELRIHLVSAAPGVSPGRWLLAPRAA
jgi:hypothetical protein